MIVIESIGVALSSSIVKGAQKFSQPSYAFESFLKQSL